VVEFYRDAAADGPRFAAMADLVERLAASPYAAGLHPVTSHYLLQLFPNDEFDFSDDQIQVEHDGEAFDVRYVALARVHRHDRVPTKSHWKKRSPDGFAALERCLHHLRWFTVEPQSQSRPAV
jgi:hypothetical protein